MKLELSNKRAWIVGAGGGIGRAAATAASKYCQDLYLIDRYKIASIPDGCESCSCNLLTIDCTDPGALKKLSRISGAPDILIIAAGTVLNRSFLKTQLLDIQSLVDNNLLLVILCIQEFLSHDVKAKRTVIVVTSNGAFLARPNQSIYACLKSAIVNLVKSLAVEYGPYGIRLNAVAPGTVWVNRNDEEIHRRLENPPFDPSRPLGRISKPEDLISTFEYLLSDTPITGQTIIVDGGSGLC